MRLLRIGEPGGAERPAVLDAEGTARDVSEIAGDLGPAFFAHGGLGGLAAAVADRLGRLARAARRRHPERDRRGALAAACRFIDSLPAGAVEAREGLLTGRLVSGLSAIEGVRTLRLWPDSGDHGRIGVVSFTVDGWPAQHVAQYLSAEHGIGVRDGRFCAHPLLARLTPASVVPDGAAVRASLGLGSRAADVDRLVDALDALRAQGPSWAYADAAGGSAPRPDPRVLPRWLAGGPAGRPSPCAG